MIIGENYILTAEIADRLGNHIACYSKWSSDEELLLSGEVVKLSRAIFVRNDARCLTHRMKSRLKEFEFTNFSNVTPLAYLKKNFGFNTKFAEKRGLGEAVRMCFNTSGKQSQEKTEIDFFRFDPKIADLLKSSVVCHVREDELDMVSKHVQVSRLNYIGLY